MRVDELTADGIVDEEITADLDGSLATLYNWRRAYRGTDTDAAKETQRAARAERPIKAAAGRYGRRTGCDSRTVDSEVPLDTLRKLDDLKRA